jgi:hypothetical protein
MDIAGGVDVFAGMSGQFDTSTVVTVYSLTVLDGLGPQFGGRALLTFHVAGAPTLRLP